MATASGHESDGDWGPAGQIPPRQLIVTIYGLYSRATDGWMSVASLVHLLADLGVDESAVRSSVSRLKRAGMLESEAMAAAAGYRLSDQARRMLRDGDQRIFSARRATLDEGWVLVVFSVPESERAKRHTLRTQLTRLGFGAASPGVWIAPGHVHDEVEDVLARLELRSYADLFRADYLAVTPDLPTKVRRWWDTERLQDLYLQFLAVHRPVTELLAQGGPATDAEAFTAHIRVLTDWRRLVYLDPGVARELLPAKWSGTEASEVFDELHARLAGPARRHVERVRSR
ncbi:PaaX family transcriptional regulator [Streptomyces sp. NBC_00873]|uniref:PaaX family transcriptional regulator n=1 Tax=unclassified Streptomyces TaxID=2593676 RepID=UPI00386C5C5F|nr:PaaX family transcriptional regulator [Streptomyces sp. NBC_00873]WSY96724.1 PaaX family transcriptional regulator [Streptomyces sp. NBC_00873]WTA41502.1 PaaX family transcriptional regulator [Streptomyces sp. NBC_00842]WTA48394.1 PaaX family transcriptional regulator [Streptomyces sp. NBC_00842]